MTNNPAQRRPDESPRAYARFRLYLALPAHKRTLAEVARVVGVTRQAIHLQAVRHDWAERLPVPNYLSFAAYGGRNPLLEALREREAQQNPAGGLRRRLIKQL